MSNQNHGHQKIQQVRDPHTFRPSQRSAAGPREAWSPRLGQGIWETLDESVDYVRLFQQLLLF